MTIHEPATLWTDYLLTFFGVVLAWRLSRQPAFQTPTTRWWHRALLVLALSAFVGGSYHGFAPNFPDWVDTLWWRVVLWVICLLGYTLGAALVCEFSSDANQSFLKRMLIIKFLIASIVIAVTPDFLVAIIDYGSAMLAWLVAALITRRPWRAWIIAAVSLSIAAAWVQQSGFQRGNVLNHNDIFHLIQALALGAFYQAARRMRGDPADGAVILTGSC